MLSAAFRLFLAALSALALYYSFLFARSQAFLLDPSVPGFSAAIKLVPFNPAGYVALSQLQPDRASTLLKTALALNQFDAPTWIRLGFAAEFQDHDLALAEQSYLHAERINRGYYSRANLVNFYFRQQRAAEFEHWLPLALQMNSSNPTLLFAEQWQISPDAAANLASIPNRPEILLSYAGFLLDSHRFDAAEPALDRAMTLMSGKEPTSLLAKYVPSVERNIDFFGSCLDRLIAANHYQAAQRLASALFAKQVLPYPAPTATKPLTNGDFRIAVFHHGFDWLFAVPPNMVPGVTIDQFPESAKLHFSFSGQQPENCRLIEQYVILEPRAQYRMEWDASSDSIPRESGFTWRLVPIVNKATGNGPNTAAMLVSPDLLPERPLTGHKADTAPPSASSPTPGPTPDTASWTFTAPAVPLNVLVLEYNRNLGTTRPEGELSLRAVSLTRQ